MSGARSTRTRFGSTAPQLNPDEDRGKRGSEEESEDKGVPETQEKKGKKVKPKYICKGGDKVCGLTIADEDDSVGCDLCDDWFHLECQGITVEAFNILSEFDFIWLCPRCKPNFMNMLKLGTKLESKMEAVEQKILGALKPTEPTQDMSKELEKKLVAMEEVVTERLVEQQKEVEKSLKAQKEVVQSMPKIQSELQKSTQELKKMIEKNDDKEKREVNIIIHNIPESKSNDSASRRKYDENSFQNIVEALLGERHSVEMDKVYRLGRKKEVGEGEEGEPKPRLMLVGLKKKEDVERLMKERWHLNKVGFSNIYITRDLSPDEREQQRKLREEWAKKGKDTHRIFQGRVVPRK